MSLLPVGIGSEEGGYEIERSLRFNSADSAYLDRTFGTATNTAKWTFNRWIKRGAIGARQSLFAAGSSGSSYANIEFKADDTIQFVSENSALQFQLVTTQVFRDPSGWYNIHIIYDSANATSTDRIQLWVNGIRVTAFSTATYPSAPSNLFNTAINHQIGVLGYASTAYFSGYLAEVHFIDGQALTPTSFGEFNSDTGVWQPIKYTGTYGTNGFYLDFADNTSTTTLGYDAAGSNDWTLNNFSVTAGAGNDSLVDSPTRYGTDTGAGGEVRGNYCTMNPLDSKNGTASNGNLLWTATASQSDIRGTFAIPAFGKYYLECTVGSNTSATSAVSFGLATSSVALDASNAVTGLYQLYASSSGYLSLNGSNVSSSLGTWTAGDILQIAVDADNTKMWLGKNNTWYDSSGGTTGNPSTGANATSTTSMVGLFPFSNCYQNNATWNAGQRPFAYTAPSGFKALVTTNLPTPTIEDGGEYFNAILYTGTGSSNARTGVGFQPDLVWIKERSGAADHALYDAVRGVQNQLESNTTTAETAEANGLTAFGADGFTVGSLAQVNTNTDTYVAWNWKANGAGSSNTAGTITSTVSANTDAGFSIVTYTGTGANATVGHGLGVAPSMVIVKCRSNAISAPAWPVWHPSLAGTEYLDLQTTAAKATAASVWNSTTPTSTVFSVGTTSSCNSSSFTYVAYCFAPVAGYSAFGSYTGNGSTDGPFVYTGFRPAFVMFKMTSSTNNWIIMDSERNTYNVVDKYLLPNASDAEASYSVVDFLSNGFKIRNTSTGWNGSGSTYIYAAFAENPFKYALAR